MKQVLTVLLSLSFVSTPLLEAQQSPPSEWTVLTQRLETSVLSDDAAGIRQARTELLRLLAAGPAPDRAPLIHYAIAYAGWRLSVNPHLPDRERDDLLDEAERHLKSATHLDPKFAEGFALLSGVYGLKIAHSPFSGIVLGPRAGGAIDKARSLEPDNPRVLVALGVNEFNTPAMFGGSKKDAETNLRRALDRFATEPTDKPFPAWGRFDAHVWLGQVLADRGDVNGARAEYTAALAIAPQSGWVRYVLMPALDKK